MTAVDNTNADILIVDGRIQTIGKSIAAGADVKVHDANGLWSCPVASTCIPLDWEFGPTHTVDTFETGQRPPPSAKPPLSSTLQPDCREEFCVGLEDWHKRRASACVDVARILSCSTSMIIALPT